MLPKQALQQMHWPKLFEPGNVQLKVIQLEPYLLILPFPVAREMSEDQGPQNPSLFSTKDDTESGGN